DKVWHRRPVRAAARGVSSRSDMSRNLSLIPAQQMRLEQRLTPQLIQSMEILQLPLPALEARIREELASDPVPEEEEPQSPAQKTESPTETTPPAAETEAEREAKAFERLERLSREYEFDPADQPYAPTVRSNGDRDAKLDAMAKTPTRGVSLLEHL